jgi:hypothetical protein
MENSHQIIKNLLNNKMNYRFKVITMQYIILIIYNHLSLFSEIFDDKFSKLGIFNA